MEKTLLKTIMNILLILLHTKYNVVNYVLQIQLLLTNNLTTAILQRNL